MNAIKAFSTILLASTYTLFVITLAVACTLISAVRELYKELVK